MMPPTHYCRYLLTALNARRDPEERIIALSGDRGEVSPLDNTPIVEAWKPDAKFPREVEYAFVQTGAQIAHVQHEFNMYGGPRGALLFPQMLRRLRKRGRVVLTIHSVFPPEEVDLDFLKTFKWPRSQVLIVAARALFRYVFGSAGRIADEIIVHSETMKRAMVDSYGTPSGKVHVIPIGVTPAPSTGPTRFDSALQGSRVILYFGYLVRRKGLPHLIEAFAALATEHPDVKLVLAGGTHSGHEDHVEELRQQAARAGLADRVIFTGFVSEAEMHALYAQSVFVALPYTYSISASLPLSLAATHAKPVVATDIATMAEEVDPDVTGLLVPPRNSEALLSAMRRLLSDPKLLSDLGGGMARLASRRDWSHVAEATEKVYERLRR